jgi:hypothetical protein
MSKHAWMICCLLGAAALSLPAAAGYRAPGTRSPDVTVEVLDERGSAFQQVPVRGTGGAFRAYLQADRGARYRIRISNTSGSRVGVVVAVDGRNIINGARSELTGGEAKYVLAPYESQEYSGWRTSLADVHEFYFTEWEDAYAEAFGDRSARGVIAVAVYREKQPIWLSQELERRKRMDAPRDAVGGAAGADTDRAAPRASAPPPAANGALESQPSRDAKAERSEPGTGYGEVRNEPAVRVAFDAEPRASSRVFLKYEWHDTLCRKRILDCDSEPANRLWPDDALSFAPPPPPRALQR